MAYTPDINTVKTVSKRTIFSSSQRFRYRNNGSPGPKYNGDKLIVKPRTAKAVVGTTRRFPVPGAFILPGPRYESSLSFVKPKTPATRFSTTARGSAFRPISTPGPSYNVSREFSAREKSAPSARFGTARRWPKRNTLIPSSPGPRYSPIFEAAAKRQDVVAAKLR
mmetsp:Transcript_14138/g.23077  ORF Transcript_14138/g.23077 Transcript_14138/m.23077 type:complete len:166 (+) Transcript_14138:199-696(+)